MFYNCQLYTLKLVFRVVLCLPLFVFFPFSVGHCIVIPSSSYGFLIPFCIFILCWNRW